MSSEKSFFCTPISLVIVCEREKQVAFSGSSVGALLGRCVGVYVGCNVGFEVAIGCIVGISVGFSVGIMEGIWEGSFVGLRVSPVSVGPFDGDGVGYNDGFIVGEAVTVVGLCDGDSVSVCMISVGDIVGLIVGD